MERLNEIAACGTLLQYIVLRIKSVLSTTQPERIFELRELVTNQDHSIPLESIEQVREAVLSLLQSQHRRVVQYLQVVHEKKQMMSATRNSQLELVINSFEHIESVLQETIALL